MKRESIVSLCCLPGVPVCSLLSVRTLILAGFLCLAQSINLHAQTTLSAGDIVFTAINTDNNDRFAFVALVDISEGTDIVFTDEGWTGSDFRGINEDTGIWTAPAGGITAGTVIEIEGATVTGGGTWQDEALDSLADGDQILAYQVFPGSTNFIAGIGAGAGSGNWIDTGTPDASKSYIPEPLGLGTNVVGFTSDNGYFSGLSTNTASGLARYISDDSNWTLDSITRVWPTSWDFEVNDELSAGDIVFTAINTDGPDRFAFVALTDIPANTAISFTDEGWTGTDFRGTLEETGIWFSPPAGIAAGTVIEIEGATVTGGGTWQGEPLVSLADGDQVLAYQGHDDNPHFLAGIGAGTGSGNWIDTDTPDANESYIPEPLGLGTNVVGFTSDNGYFSGLSTNTASGLARYISDDSNWTLDSITRVWPTSWDFEVNDELSAGDIVFTAINTDGPDRFAFVALTDIPANTAISFTDEGWTGTDFRGTSEETGIWFSPPAGINAGTVIEIEGSTITGGGTWQGEPLVSLADGDQVLAYQGHDDNPHFLAGIGAGAGSGNWIDTDTPDANESYIPEPLGLGTNVVGFTSDNGYFSGLSTNTASGLARYISDDSNWTLDSITRVWPTAWGFEVNDELPVGDIAFVGYNADGTESFAFMAIADIPGNYAIAFTDIGWSNNTFITPEDVGTWISPGAGVSKGTVVTVSDIGSTMSADTGIWLGDDIGTINVGGDQLLAYQGHSALPHFLAGVSTTDWVTDGALDNETSYLPASLTLGVNAVSFNSVLENGYVNANKTTGSRWGYLTAINNHASWTRNDSGVTYPSWSFSVADTPSVAVGTIAFVAFQTDDPERFAFVTTSAMAAGTEIAFTDTSHDGTNFVLSLNEEIGVWTVPAGGLPGASVIEIEGTSVTGGGTMSGALDDLSVAGDQIFAFQGYVTNPVFVAGLCTKNWSTTGTPNNNNSYLPDSLTDGVNAVSWTAGGEMDNGYYSGDTEAEIASELLSWINDNSNWTRDDNTQTWPEWEIRITSGTIFIFR